ncbi:hypothetical protein, partial [Legionella pneumophila]
MPGYAQKLFVWQRVIIKTTITEREFEYKQINLEGLFTLSIARIQQDFVWEYHIRSLIVILLYISINPCKIHIFYMELRWLVVNGLLMN